MNQCSQTVWRDDWHKTRCSRKATVEREGKLYCTQHDPERKAQLKAKQIAKLQQTQCPKCGSSPKSYWAYCPFCGTKYPRKRSQ